MPVAAAQFASVEDPSQLAGSLATEADQTASLAGSDPAAGALDPQYWSAIACAMEPFAVTPGSEQEPEH